VSKERRGKRGGYYYSVHVSKCCEMRASHSIVLLSYARARAVTDSGSSLRPCTIVVDNTLWYSRVLRSPGDPSDVCTQVMSVSLMSVHRSSFALSPSLARSRGPCPYSPLLLPPAPSSLSVRVQVCETGWGACRKRGGKGE
jgi:hypothetical protein